jgi:hypothetical protein
MWFLDPKCHDSVGDVVTLSEFRTMDPDIPIKNLCLDSAKDVPATNGLAPPYVAL